MKPQELLKFFTESRCIFDLKATDKRGALSEMVESIVRETPMKNGDVVLEMLLNREALGSTGISRGVAFPHGRSLAATNLTMLFARSKQGLDFNALDNEPTHLFFLIIAPPQDRENLYLQVLGRLVELTKTPEVRDTLLAAEDFESLTEAISKAK